MYEGDYLSNSISPYSPAKRVPVISLRATPNAGAVGVPTAVTLSWTIEYAASASIDQGIGAIAPTSGSRVVSGVVATTTWTLTVTPLNGTPVQAQATYTAS